MDVCVWHRPHTGRVFAGTHMSIGIVLPCVPDQSWPRDFACADHDGLSDMVPPVPPVALVRWPGRRAESGIAVPCFAVVRRGLPSFDRCCGSFGEWLSGQYLGECLCDQDSMLVVRAVVSALI